MAGGADFLHKSLAVKVAASAFAVRRRSARSAGVFRYARAAACLLEESEDKAGLAIGDGSAFLLHTLNDIRPFIDLMVALLHPIQAVADGAFRLEERLRLGGHRRALGAGSLLGYEHRAAGIAGYLQRRVAGALGQMARIALRHQIVELILKLAGVFRFDRIYDPRIGRLQDPLPTGSQFPGGSFRRLEGLLDGQRLDFGILPVLLIGGEVEIAVAVAEIPHQLGIVETLVAQSLLRAPAAAGCNEQKENRQGNREEDYSGLSYRQTKRSKTHNGKPNRIVSRNNSRTSNRNCPYHSRLVSGWQDTSFTKQETLKILTTFISSGMLT